MSEANFSQLDVRVTGDLGAGVGIPVANAPVRFRIASSPPFGKLSIDTTAAPVLSNAGGSASGTLHSRGRDDRDRPDRHLRFGRWRCDAAERQRRRPATPNEKAAKLTISQQPLFVRISTNNEIAKVNNNLDYEKPFSIYVTNAAGQGGCPVR